MNKKEQKIYKVEEQATKTTTSFMHEQIMYIATNEVNLHSDLTEVAMALLKSFQATTMNPEIRVHHRPFSTTGREGEKYRR